jgi:hypothetical protein
MKIKRVLDVKRIWGRGQPAGWEVSLLIHFPPGKCLNGPQWTRSYRQIVVLHGSGRDPRTATFSVCDTMDCFGRKESCYQGHADEAAMVERCRKAIVKFLKKDPTQH